MKEKHKYSVTMMAGNKVLKLTIDARDISSAAELGKEKFNEKYRRAPESVAIKRKE